MNNIDFKSSAVHIALTTFPLGNDQNYIEIIEGIYQNFRNSVKLYSGSFPDPVDDLRYKFYFPLKYHLFGHFDIAFISLIDSYKFAQGVFDNEKLEISNNNTYQVQTGAIINQNFFIKESKSTLYDLHLEYPFIQITNLKLNNGILIGNGLFFRDIVVEKIISFLSPHEANIKFIVLNSFNWSDLILITISDDASNLCNIMSSLRNFVLGNIIQDATESNTIINNSLYKKVFDFNYDTILHSHIFVDTQSYIGISHKVFNHLDDYPKIKASNLNTEVEWQLKPGHFDSFYNSINSKEILFEKSFMKCGKTDYITLEKEQTKLLSNYNIFTSLRSTSAFEHVRKIKTTPFFDNPNNQQQGLCVDLETNDPGKYINEQLRYFKFSENELLTIHSSLKKIKLSRQLRMKIRKVFHNYNNGITTISYIYFIDFLPFLKFLERKINTHAEQIDNLIHGKISSVQNHSFNIRFLEIEFEKILETFDDVYCDRILNNNNYEDINDFNIDFNTSLTRLISTYDSLIKLLSPYFFDYDLKMLVRQNELITVSNLISINYNSFHLLEPALIFNTIAKEILNSFKTNLETLESKDDNTLNNIPKLKDNIKLILDSQKIISNEIANIIEQNKSINNKLCFGIGFGDSSYFDLFDLDYFLIDVTKYFYTFNANTELYVYWSWIYFFQNTSLYSPLGSINEHSFISELMRITLIVSTFDKGYLKNMNTPIPEVFSLWDQHFLEIKKIILLLIQATGFKKIVKAIIFIYNDFIIQRKNTQFTSDLNWEMIEDVNSSIYRNLKLDSTESRDDFAVYKDKLHTYSINKKLRPFYDNDSIRISEERWRLLELFFLDNVDKIDKDSQPILYDESKFDLPLDYFFNCISYLTLRWYYRKTHGKICLLRRDYNMGVPIEKFINCKN